MHSRETLLVHVAQLYYEQSLSQQRISELLGISRPTVSRLLEEARASGVVEITVHAPLETSPELSRRLREELGLREAVVAAGSHPYDRALGRCARAAGDLFLAVLDSGMTVGITWGRALREFCTRLPEQKHLFQVNVVQMIGCLGTGNPHLDGLELSLMLAKKLNGTFCNVYAPVYVDSELVQSYLHREPSVALAVQQSQRCDIVVSGIGSLTDPGGSLLSAGYYDRESLTRLRQAGAVGILQGRLLDREGREVDNPGRYVVGADLEALRRAKWCIGVNAGASRTAETLAAVRSGCLNALVVDEPLAKELLKMNRYTEK